jgi:hypothetical protein
MSQNNIITLNTVIQRNDKKFLANSLGEEMVMMNMENGDFISMNRVGADIWTIAGQQLSVKELITKLTGIYNITEDQCSNETIHFLQASMEQNMFTIYNHING